MKDEDLSMERIKNIKDISSKISKLQDILDHLNPFHHALKSFTINSTINPDTTKTFLLDFRHGSKIKLVLEQEIGKIKLQYEQQLKDLCNGK